MIGFLRHHLFRDFWLKLLSLALAVLTWKIVSLAIHRDVSAAAVLSNEALPEQTYYNVPVTVVFAATDVRAVRVSPAQVQITVRGESRLLRALQPRDIHAEVDLAGIRARALHKQLDVTTPPGITVVQIVPDNVEVIIPDQP
jgi:YbbR domain-containing protein